MEWCLVLQDQWEECEGMLGVEEEEVIIKLIFYFAIVILNLILSGFLPQSGYGPSAPGYYGGIVCT